MGGTLKFCVRTWGSAALTKTPNDKDLSEQRFASLPRYSLGISSPELVSSIVLGGQDLSLLLLHQPLRVASKMVHRHHFCMPASEKERGEKEGPSLPFKILMFTLNGN